MKLKKYILPLFCLMVVAQIYVPTKMILDKEAVIKEGEEYRFRVAPIDPYDPFRGKYIALRFADNTVQYSDAEQISRGERLYITFKKDKENFAIPSQAMLMPPTDTEQYLLVAATYSGYKDKLHLQYPFDRYYMEESKALPAEQLYREAQRDTSITAYAVVSIKNGEAVLERVEVDGVPIEELVKERLFK